MSRQVVQGPGSLRVGRFIGRVGVVSLPAVRAGLDLDERVVRRHVAKLEAAGLARTPWVWGEGSVVWLTAAGMEGAGLGAVRAIKSPPAPTTIAHGVLVGWSAARNERRGRRWSSARELALDRERWAVPMRRERGYADELPDVAVWLEGSNTPGAVIAESGGRREDRQKMILEGWRDAIWSGRYLGVRYDCVSPSVAHWISRLATKVGLTDSHFTAAAQTTTAQIAALSPAALDDEPDIDDATASGEPARGRVEQVHIAHILRSFIDRLRDRLGIPYPLAHARPFVGDGRQLVWDAQEASGLDPDFCLVAEVRGQLVLTGPSESFFSRVRWNDAGIAAAWRPASDPDSPVRIDPELRFGRPAIKGISTETLWEHVDAGEDPSETAEAFGLDLADVRWALSYETARLAA